MDDKPQTRDGSIHPVIPTYTPGEFKGLMADSHGWVIPRPDGTQARCGGPRICRVCQLELAVYSSRGNQLIIEGFTLKPGDKLLLIAPPDADFMTVREVVDRLRREYPEVFITAVSGFTGIQIKNEEPTV